MPRPRTPTARHAGRAMHVTGNGRGIAPVHLPHIFNPFDRTKPPGSGTGPGPSVGFGIVCEHGGHIQAQSLLRQGAPYTVVVPTRDTGNPAPAG